MAIVRPSDITTERSSPVASEYVVVDNDTTVAKATIANVVAAGRPLANQAEAEAGANATKAMTPLTTKQHVDKRISDGDTVPAGSVTAAKISNLAAEWDAIAAKLRVLDKDAPELWFDANTGDDLTGNGTEEAPYKTWDRVKQDLAALGFGRATVVGGGTVTTASRDASTMIRPALLYIDQLKMGQRTDAPGGELTGGLTIKSNPLNPLILQPNATYPRGFYVTGHVGSVGFQDILIDCQTGAESGGVAHRGAYVHTNNVEVDGNGIATFGLITEAGGYMENLNANVHHVAIGGLAYPGTTNQFSLATEINNCSTYALQGAGGYISVTDGATIAGGIFGGNGGTIVINGATTTIAGDIVIRPTCGYVGGSYAHTSGTFTNYGDVELASVGYNGRFVQFAGTHRFDGVNSYVAPATASAVAEPYTIFGGTGHVNTASNIVALGGGVINAAGEKITSGKPKGHIHGLTLVNSGTDATNDIIVAVGVCRDVDDSVDIVLSVARTKQLDAEWAAGNNAGGRDTGSIADGTWHVFMIRNPSTQGVDILFSLSASSPTMPSGYTQKRRIGSIIRSSGAILAFVQTGDRFLLGTPVVDYTANPNTTSAITVTLASVPAGIGVTALLHGHMLDNSATAARVGLITSLGQADTAPTAGGIGQFQTTGASGSVFASCGGLEIPTNTLRQIRARLSAADTDLYLRLVTDGWLDTRGRLD